MEQAEWDRLELWRKFFVGKNRKSRASYKLRRVCISCGQPVVDANRSGYCSHCLQAVKYSLNKKRRRFKAEGEAHIMLKERAGQFLASLGCEHIEWEVRLGSGLCKTDVLGLLNGRKIAVECGGSLMRKLGVLQGLVDEVYILPYGEEKPFLWNSNIVVCLHCGHSV